MVETTGMAPEKRDERMRHTETLLMLAGPVLRGYLEDDRINNIFVNPNGTCLVQHSEGGKTQVDAVDLDALDRFLAAVADGVGQEWREQTPSLHAALPEVGWRIQAAMPPEVPALTMALRKHPANRPIWTLEDYRAQGILTHTQFEAVHALIQGKARLIVGGATGSGKTSIVNAILYELLKRYVALVILEDDPELIARGSDVRFFRTSASTTMSDLVVRSLRYQPDWVIVGEVRDGAAIDMANAFDTGHSGISTVHADSAEDIMWRLGELTTMPRGTGDQRQNPRHDLLGRVIDAVMHMEREDQTHKLRCTKILGVRGYAQGVYQLQPLA